jgi:rfaE bifunctional protein kinase chain/domain
MIRDVANPLSFSRLEDILARLPGLTLGVVGDLFLDRYLEIDAALNEPSIETGLIAYQVVRVRSSPGAAGTVLNNLVALGVGRVVVMAVIGDDGEGYELRQSLARLSVVETSALLADATRRTPTYTKPLLFEPDCPGRELNRLDIKNRWPLAASEEASIIRALDEAWKNLDGLLVVDQVSEEDCGVITERVRSHLAEMGQRAPDRLILADSRERIGLFRSVSMKPNRQESLRATGTSSLEAAIGTLAERADRPMFCTCGEEGILLADKKRQPGLLQRIPAYPVAGPTDIVGAGDSTSAGIACALAAGATQIEAAAFGNLVASITIQQIGTTGTASPEQLRQRARELKF